MSFDRSQKSSATTIAQPAQDVSPGRHTLPEPMHALDDADHAHAPLDERIHDMSDEGAGARDRDAHADDTSALEADALEHLREQETASGETAPDVPAWEDIGGGRTVTSRSSDSGGALEASHDASLVPHHATQARERSSSDRLKQPESAKGGPLSIADPFILVAGDIYYAYGTGATMCVSDDKGATWRRTGKMFDTSKWAIVWAPEVHQFGSTYVAYITMGRTSGSHTIHVATSDKPDRNWKVHNKPIVKRGRWTNIDATIYRDPKTNKSYLVWKQDKAASVGHKAIVMQELSADGTHLKHPARPPKPMLTAGVGAHSGLDRGTHNPDGRFSVEAPTVIRRGGIYYMFYSGGGYERGGGYFVGVATSRHLAGPYTRQAKPVLQGDKDFSEPGHQTLVPVKVGDKTEYMIYFHYRDADSTEKQRYLKRAWLHFGPDGVRAGDGTPS